MESVWVVRESVEKVLAAADEPGETTIEVEFAELGRAVCGRGRAAGEQMIRLPMKGRGEFMQFFMQVREQLDRAVSGRTRRPRTDEEPGEEAEGDGDE